MLIEDWLRDYVHRYGRRGKVKLPCDRVLAIADYIESTRSKVNRVICKDCKWHLNGHLCQQLSQYGSIETPPMFYCGFGERDNYER